MIQPALRSYHDHPTSAHFSVQRTYAKMKYKYWWPDMQRYIIDYINSCIVCKQHNYSRQKKPGHLHPITPPTGPFQVIGIDYCGPFLTTCKENKYVLCITDHFTRWVTAIALPDCSPQTTARTIFEEYVCKYGVPATILSDQGSHFLNQLMKALTALLGHNHIYSTCYHPQTNGIVERFNATFVPQLAKLQDQESDNWDEYLPSVVFAYNTGQHFSTGYSPFELQFGQDPKLPPDEPPKMVIFNRPNDYYQQLKKNLAIYHRHARQNMIRQQQLSKQRYDNNRKDPHYEVGQLVLLRMYGIRSKLEAKYSRVPSKVIEVKHPIYWVADVETRAVARVHMLFRIRTKHFSKRKLEENERLRRMLPKFKLPVVDRVVGQTDSLQQLTRRVPSFTKQPVRYYLNDATPHRFIDDLMDIVKETKYYVIDTETDIDTQAPALIQLLLIPHEIRASSALVIILIETQFLPPRGSTRRQRIQEFLMGRGRWLFVTTAAPYDIESDDHPDCTCPHRPYKDPRQPNSWSLQKALWFGYGLFLDKYHTCTNWAAGIDPTLRTFEFDNLLHYDPPKTPAQLPTFPSPDLVSQQQLEPAQHTDNSSILAPSDHHTISVLENSIASPTSQSTAISALLLLSSNDTEMPLVDRVGGHTVFSSATATIQEHQTEVLPSLSEQPITRKSRTSAHSRAIHNQKSSKKFHKKDYDIEIIRPIYFQFDIHQAKNILRGLGLRFRKVMIVNRQFLRIGLWAEAQRNEFELRLHHNLFTLGHYIRLYGRPAIQRHSPSRQHQ
ncbi:unnamed protein product [Didymodactylos carnosus]|uniref:Integrase catalytic domain-containing protein n=1 Tax=Didymodactylos carnosus TaxID=1234261 RepID=A0A8S2DRK3_9BILA|nr:unnamed protein product [Didymodactylos carnosus]CAF3782643.1 unnamed protein product [Didymodactylos carnosus]